MGKPNTIRGQQRAAKAVSCVVYGPQGSGKTLHGQVIAANLGLRHVRDLDDVQLSGDRLQRHGYLYLANCRDYGQRAAQLLGSRLLHIDQVLAAIGIRRQGVGRG
ncbi:TPA: hypothetical protein RNS66_000429 [Stenotrophomonas maltophilia]|nr:hypothetical protein [Stenotrophomonas maltophilia]HDX0938466.1 hypothetical protein [Stenotrophomonas maltophilia]